MNKWDDVEELANEKMEVLKSEERECAVMNPPHRFVVRTKRKGGGKISWP
jgi:hypothetical protein